MVKSARRGPGARFNKTVASAAVQPSGERPRRICCGSPGVTQESSAWRSLMISARARSTGALENSKGHNPPVAVEYADLLLTENRRRGIDGRISSDEINCPRG